MAIGKTNASVGASSGGSTEILREYIWGPQTWTKPAGLKHLLVVCVGSGGGGGSGRRGAASTNRCGGGGGAGGSIVRRLIKAADLPASVTITVGMGGVGGAARTTDNTNGALY